MATQSNLTTEAQSALSRSSVPPLENGARLTRREFERRFEAMPQVKKAELIEGVAYVPSPLHHQGLGKPHSSMVGWLVAYAAATPGVEVSDNATVRLDVDNEFQPDVLLRRIAGGLSRTSEDDYIEGAPELVVEVAASSTSIDLHEKKRVYRRAGVKEYVVWQVYEDRLDWFALREGEYIPLAQDATGVYQSQVFPGLRLAVKALLEGDLAAVMAELQMGLATPEHAVFAATRPRPG